MIKLYNTVRYKVHVKNHSSPTGYQLVEIESEATQEFEVCGPLLKFASREANKFIYFNLNEVVQISEELIYIEDLQKKEEKK